MSSNPGLPQGSVDRDAYVVRVLEQLYRALGHRDVFASRRTAGPTPGRGCWTGRSGRRCRPACCTA
ncbi:hypothetical protein [Streptosporangium sandarakinum]|uniref:hypothetical protein n=1 Tax=Streptosporangium sandarakinum TaxID=1260955 RepID=UPI0037963DE1